MITDFSEKLLLVIVPGWGGTRETWSEFIGLAEKYFAISCVELPCFGEEPCPTEVWGVAEYASFLKNKLLSLGVSGADMILLGHSFGGVVATRLVADNPNICSRLILSGPPIIRKKKGISKAIFWGAAKIGKIIFRVPFIEKFDVYARKVFYAAIKSDYNQSSGIQKEIFKKIISEDQTGILSGINIPTLVIFGDKDTYVDPRDGEKIASLIPNAELRLIAGGRHGLHMQQPENLLRIISEFKNSGV
ncbi:MAG: alpha/beta hydrolase [Patescibacteria group bacterium]